jgi:methyl-accepting chemotaxis protein
MFSSTLCFGSDDLFVDNLKDKTVISNLFILESPFSPGSYLSGDIDSQGFSPYIAGPLPQKITNTRNMYTFRAFFIVDESLSGTLLSLYLAPNSYPYNVYINGSRILSRGSYGKDYYQSSSYETLSLQLREGLLKYGDNTNEIAIQAFPLGDISPFPAPVLSSEEKTSRLAFVRNFFNVYFIQASFVISLFIGLYFLLLCFAHKFSELHYLYFTFMCIFFSASYVNNSFTFNSVDEVMLEKISYFAMPIAAYFLTLFVLSLTRIANRIWLIVIITIPVFIHSVYILTLSTKFDIDTFFNNYTLIFLIAPFLAFGFIVLSVSYLRTRRQKYLIILSAYVLCVIASVHDIYYQLNFLTPFCWLVPYGFFVLVLSIFILLAMEESAIFNEANKRRIELDRKNESMKTVLEKLETVSRNLIRSSGALDDNTLKAASIISETGEINRTISRRLKTQLSEIEKVTGSIASKMESSSDKIPKAVENQTAVVEETNRTVNGMNIHIEKILRSIILTENISRELSNIASNSKEIVKQSRDSIGKISENTNFISEVLENIREIVEESNFLSVNASIESSYAGEAGQGFSILASEIRQLANKSKERLDLSQERLKQMNFNINDSIRLTDDVGNHLLTIIEQSRNSADMIEKISKLMYEHKVESNAILEGSGNLLKDTMSIKAMTDEDYKESEKLRQTMIVLKKSFEDMSKLITSHEVSENNIRSAVDHIQEVLAENLKTIELLKEAFTTAGTEGSF